MQKPTGLLSVDEQVAYLADKGVGLNIVGADEARRYLQYNNNYFKLTAYRKNYQKHPGGAKAGQYVRLEFAYLVDLAEIDRLLRHEILQLSLDIEHHTKLALLRVLEGAGVDSYGIVAEYMNSLNERDRHILDSEIARNRGNVYCGDLVDKYDGRYPVWAFLELISFGKLISIYNFCGKRFDKREMISDYRALQSCRAIRNAAAHNSCILNDCRTGTAKHYQGGDFARALAMIEGISKTARKTRMSNARLQQLAVLLYMHRRMVANMAERREAAQRMDVFVRRMNLHSAYYADNPLLASTFSFLTTLIDSWMISGYNEIRH